MPRITQREGVCSATCLGIIFLTWIFCFPALGKDKVDPCSLLTPLQLSNLLNTKVGQGIHRSLEKGYCSWKILEKGSKQKINLWAATDLASEYDKGKAGPSSTQWLKGIGDEAYWNSQSLYVRQGDLYLQVEMLPSNNPKNFDASKQIAELAVSRLKAGEPR